MAKEREDKVRTHRLLQMDKWIISGSYPSIEKMRAEYGVSRRTVLRDIEFLRDRYKAPLEYDKERGGYYYTDPAFMIQNVFLTEGDLFTVSTVMPLLEQYKNTPLEDSFRRIMAKIAEMLPRQVSVDASFLNKDVSFISDPLPKIEPRIFEAVFKALRSRRVARFDYKSSGSSVYKKKTFDAYHVVCQKGSWYVIGFDHDAVYDKGGAKKAGKKDGQKSSASKAAKKGAVRIYALSRIRSVELLAERFVVDKDFDLEKSIDLSFGVWNNPEPPEEFEILFEPRLANYVTEREWHKSQKIKANKDGSVTLKFKSNQKEIVLSWVMGFGSSAKVIKPAWLAEQIRSDAKRVAALYK